ncbi:hypothetical protein E3N88_28725 [Mikania micrantha]|uniref:Uncharacterized protein n=1 Tax=Mikania micrantha TaxID=192012 RepID=A0A5N6N1W6_9ASTR|nr:hypothetical protein E3N88_28725 [Mikania micrantha]
MESTLTPEWCEIKQMAMRTPRQQWYPGEANREEQKHQGWFIIKPVMEFTKIRILVAIGAAQEETAVQILNSTGTAKAIFDYVGTEPKAAGADPKTTQADPKAAGADLKTAMVDMHSTRAAKNGAYAAKDGAEAAQESVDIEDSSSDDLIIITNEDVKGY